MYLNEKLKLLREQNNLTQLQFAKIINASQSAISDWEKGKRMPKLKHIKTIAKLFKIKCDYLIGLTDDII